VYQCHFLPESKTIYHSNHIIAALITGAVSQTMNTKNTINHHIITTCIILGKYFTKNHTNIINIVILNQLTAMK
jgi:hypothetical protein